MPTATAGPTGRSRSPTSSWCSAADWTCARPGRTSQASAAAAPSSTSTWTPRSLNNHVTGCDVLHDDLRTFLPFALDAVPTTGDRAEWLAALAEQREAWPDTAENVPATGLNPNLAVRQILQARPAAAAVVTDVGQHQMWAAQSAALSAGQRFLTSGGMGSMGFGLPAAIGSALASQGEVVLIAGDGGFQCNIQEAQTLVRQQAPVRVVVFDNGCHGMVRQFQESYFDKRYYSTKWGYSAPDFCAVARAYEIPAFHAEDHEQARRGARRRRLARRARAAAPEHRRRPQRLPEDGVRAGVRVDGARREAHRDGGHVTVGRSASRRAA